jgi:hypothetical protein
MLIRMKRFVSHARYEQSGVALAAVIGVMAVALLVMTLVTTSIVSGVGHTSATRAGVQSQAAAEAGIAAARAVVDAPADGNHPCTNPYTSGAGATPKYSVAISWSAVAPPTTPTTWTPGCPPLSAAQIRYVSTGTAAAGGVAGQTAQNTSSIESIYGGNSVTTTATGTNAAIYSYGFDASTNGGSGLTGGVGLLNTLAVGGPKATIQVKNGDATCSGLNLNASADWVIQNGSFTDNGLCLTINGSIWASGSVSITGLLGLGLASISGSVTAGSLTMSGLSGINGGAWIKGNASLTPLLSNVTGGLTSPSLKSNQAGPSPYGNPTVPDWYDYNFISNAAASTSPQWPGFTVITLALKDCNTAGINGALGALSAGPLVIDAQICTNGNLLSGIQIGNFSNDVALILSSSVNFDIAGVHILTGTHKTWIIQTDRTPDHKPTCQGGSITRSGITLAFPNLMIYTPCSYSESGLLSGNTYTGQIYAGQVSLGGLIRVMNYEPIGLPGVDLSTGTSTATGTRVLISTRNVQSGG